MTTTIPDEPLGRKEMYLAAIAGENVVYPEPLGREEMYLAYIAENGGGGGGTTNYNDLTNKPQINSVTLQGNKSASDLGLAGLEGNTFTQTQKVNSAAYAGMKLQDGSQPSTIFTDFGKTGMYISDGDGVVTLAYKNIANKTELGGKEDTSNKVTSMSASSTDTQYPSAKAVYDKDANLQTQITNLQNMGRFLAIWNATTGVPTSEPTVQPYNYRTGDYYRVGTAGTRIPAGSEYVIGGTNYVEGDECAIGDVFYYDGTSWNKQAAGSGGAVQDVQVNGVSVLSGGIANVPVPTVTQSAGTSTTDVMSQKAVTDMIELKSSEPLLIGNSCKKAAGVSDGLAINYGLGRGDTTTKHSATIADGSMAIAMHNGAHAEGFRSIAIGGSVTSSGEYSITLCGGYSSSGPYPLSQNGARSNYSIAIGGHSAMVPANAVGSIALGSYSGGNIASAGTMDIGSSATFCGYNYSNYRLLTGLYDPQNDHDAATKGYVDTNFVGMEEYDSTATPQDNVLYWS